MEIIQERLEREFNLDLVTTLPSVIYEVSKTDGDTLQRCDNPHELSRVRMSSRRLAEPYVKASIMTPQEFVGNIMPNCARTAAAFLRICSIWTPIWSSCITKCRLGEIIYDFFDALKARTQGLCIARL